MTVEQIAQVAHEINKAYCESIGDQSQTSWNDAPQWQKDSAMNGVKFHLANPDASPSASHVSWYTEKLAAGWKYGPVKNPETREHPCMVAYEELPVEQRTKDYLFKQTIESLKKFLISTATTPTRGQQVMSVTFNPGQREDVAAIKQIFADAFDTIDIHVKVAHDVNSARLVNDIEQEMERAARGQDISRLSAIAKTNLETAQMYAVKAVTR